MIERRLVVDAMNVIGTRPTGWWRDRDGAIRLLIQRLQQLALTDRLPITVVVDGRPLADLIEGDHGGVQVLYAPRPGANAADDRIIELIAAHPEPSTLDVITSDRKLRECAQVLGASVSGASSLLERLDSLDA